MEYKDLANKHPKTIKEAIQDLEDFFEEDLWYAICNEFKDEHDMLFYIKSHFQILRNQIESLEN